MRSFRKKFAYWIAGTAIASGGFSELASAACDQVADQYQTEMQSPTETDHQNKTFDLPVSSDSKAPPGKHFFYITNVAIHGNTAISTDDLEKITRLFTNKSNTLSDLETLRTGLTLCYIQEGYVNSGAVIPAQTVTDGVLEIEITEGKLSGIYEDKDPNEPKEPQAKLLGDSYIRDRLRTGAGTPLNINHLGKAFRLLLSDPLIDQLNARLLPGEQPGDSVLKVKAARKTPYQLYARSDNYITPMVGGFTGHVGGWINDFLKQGERIDADIYGTNDMQSVGIDTGIDLPFSLPFNSSFHLLGNAYETHLTFRYSNKDTTLTEKPLDTLNIANNVISYDGGISQSFYRSFSDPYNAIDFQIGANLSIRESDSTLSGQPYSFVAGLPANEGHSQATVLRFWQQFAHQLSLGRFLHSFAARSTFNEGLDALGATIQNNPLLPSADAFSWWGQAQYGLGFRNNAFFKDTDRLAINGRLQLAADPLLPLERTSIGGVYTVRGYRENFFVRDNGFNVNMEFHWELLDDADDKNSFQLVPFMDYGGGWNNPTLSESKPQKNYLHSVGLGFNWKYHRLDSEFYWAHAISNYKPQNASHNIQDDGIHFRVTLTMF